MSGNNSLNKSIAWIWYHDIARPGYRFDIFNHQVVGVYRNSTNVVDVSKTFVYYYNRIKKKKEVKDRLTNRLND